MSGSQKTTTAERLIPPTDPMKALNKAIAYEVASLFEWMDRKEEERWRKFDKSLDGGFEPALSPTLQGKPLVEDDKHDT